MATDIGVGDIEVPTLTVTPGDGTTAGTLTVTAPDATTNTPAVSAGTPSGGSVLLTAAAITYTQAGKWVLHWTVTGTGAGAEDREVYVNPSATAGGWPAWAPSLADAAGHVPYLTVDTTTTSASPLGTFTADTSPTDVQASRHLRDAITSVSTALSVAGTVGAAQYSQAKSAAALRAAAAILRAYPRNPADPGERATADTLDRRADAELKLLIAAVEAAADDGDFGFDTVDFDPYAAWR